jgi:hypothetical protein
LNSIYIMCLFLPFVLWWSFNNSRFEMFFKVAILDHILKTWKI